jgi:hypothetical protein
LKIGYANPAVYLNKRVGNGCESIEYQVAPKGSGYVNFMVAFNNFVVQVSGHGSRPLSSVIFLFYGTDAALSI